MLLKLYNLSKMGENSDWSGVNSSGIHYDKLAGPAKIKFDTYISEKIATEKYDILKEKYSL
jgi:hypothetical protein